VDVDVSTPLLLEVAPEIDTNPTSFYRGMGRGRGRRVAPPSDPRYRLAMSIHPTYFDLATPLHDGLENGGSESERTSAKEQWTTASVELDR